MFGLVASRVGGAAATRVARTHVVGLCSDTVTRASLGLTSRGFRTSASHAPPYPSVFNVTPERGFLPEKDPLSELPPEYSAMELLLRDMPVQRDAQRAGYLANGTFGHAVHQRLPFYDVSGVEDPELLTALFRDYTFMASAYLLEPCDLLFRTHRHYGLGRDVLPRNIAVPLVTVAEKLRAKPFMEYAMSYALYNWQRVDPKGDLSFKNLQLVRKFHGSASEAGFILVHVAMVAESGNLVRHATDVLSATEQRDVEAFDQAMQEYADCLGRINDVMETMWSRSITHDYNEFRTFIFGIKNQSMFPNLVLYEGCFGDKPVVNVRGESGSNDSIIPTTDNLLQLRFEDNPLTAILRDFRQYRPATHNAWLDEVQVAADKSGVKAFAFSDPNSAVRYLEVLDWNRAFRQRHWGFAKSYILAYSNHPVATGGSPIVTWLPNQLQGVLSAMYECISAIEASDGQLSEENKALLAEIKKRTNAQDRLLAREVEELKRGFDDTRAVDGRSAL